MTAGAIVTSALREIGLLRLGQTAAPNELSEGLASLNNLLDSWSCEAQAIRRRRTVSYPATTAISSYTLGPGGTWDGTRPLKIEAAACKLPNGFRLSVEIMAPDKFAARRDDSATADVVQALCIEPAVPQSTVRVWPSPACASNLELVVWEPLANFPDLTTDVSLEVGYVRALISNLALEIAPRMGGDVSQSLAAAAVAAKTAVVALNAQLFGGAQ